MTRSPALRLRSGQAAVAALLFGSGFCALIYQTTWLRQFRLIFGASTFATAAVLAIFMGGLGVGSALLGRRADAHPRPLAFYGSLELLIAISAALLIGAGFQLISGAIGHGEAAQHEMPALEQRLAELDGFFIPVPVQR